jgi:hypothetical protein
MMFARQYAIQNLCSSLPWRPKQTLEMSCYRPSVEIQLNFACPVILTRAHDEMLAIRRESHLAVVIYIQAGRHRLATARSLRSLAYPLRWRADSAVMSTVARAYSGELTCHRHDTRMCAILVQHEDYTWFERGEHLVRFGRSTLEAAH